MIRICNVAHTRSTRRISILGRLLLFAIGTSTVGCSIVECLPSDASCSGRNSPLLYSTRMFLVEVEQSPAPVGGLIIRIDDIASAIHPRDGIDDDASILAIDDDRAVSTLLVAGKREAEPRFVVEFKTPPRRIPQVEVVEAAANESASHAQIDAAKVRLRITPVRE